jgi:hypothetical protein
MGKTDELDNLFAPEEAKRRRDDRAAMIERNVERSAREAEIEAKRRQRAREFLAETNERTRLAEYRKAGVEPPQYTRVSLGLLLSLGWTIEEVEGRRVLVKPPTPPDPGPRRGREHYEREQS